MLEFICVLWDLCCKFSLEVAARAVPTSGMGPPARSCDQRRFR